MPRLAANVSMMYEEQPFLERFGAAAGHGFRGVEFLFPYEHPPEALAGALRSSGVASVLFNLPPGNWDAGERGLAGLPGREGDFRAALETALAYARALGCPRLHAMHGIPEEGADPGECRRVYVENLRHAARAAARHEIAILIEPLNPRDVPGYPLNRQRDALEVVRAVGEPNLQVQFDMYHCQIVEGDVAMTLREVLAHVGHVQIAGVPERHEPSTGELRYEYLLALLDELGYRGWVGCEYRPRSGTAAGLGWARAYGISAGEPGGSAGASSGAERNR